MDNKGLKYSLYRLLNESRLGSAIIALLVVLSLCVFTLETEFSESLGLKRLGLGIACVFGIEYSVRVWTASLSPKGRWHYIRSFEGIIDLLAFLPAVLISGAGASVVLRFLRIFRLLQLLKIGAVSNGIARIGKALNACKAELMVSVIISLGLIFFGAVLMYFVEGSVQPDTFGSIPRALWWAMATLTTVGYGDAYPVTALGKLVASALAFVGIGAIALPAGIIASAFMSVKNKAGQNENSTA